MDAYDFQAVAIELAIQREEEDAYYERQKKQNKE